VKAAPLNGHSVCEDLEHQENELARDLRESIARRGKTGEKPAPAIASRLHWQDACDVKPKQIDWLIKDRIPRV
jgi:hypothetical protein